MDGTNVGGNVPTSAETPASGPGDTASSERTRSGGDANLDRGGGGNVSGEATGDSSLVSVMAQMLREELTSGEAAAGGSPDETYGV